MPHLPLKTVNFILNKFEKELEKYSIEIFVIDKLQKCIVIEDSLVLFVGIIESQSPLCANYEEKYASTKDNQYMDFPNYNTTHYELYIEELTYNTLGFKHNHSRFIRELEAHTNIDFLGLIIEYKKFTGYTRPYWSPDIETLAEQIDKKIPNLRLRERYESWDGVEYNFIIMKMNNKTDGCRYAVAYSTLKPHSYILAKGKEWIKKGIHGGEFRDGGFISAFNSWKGTKRQFRLENYFEYFYLQKTFREKDEVWRYADKVLEQANKGDFKNVQYAGYTRPKNKWKSEELVYNIVKKHYKQHNVIYQHRPFFLKTDIGGQMSYDIYISGLNIAIEYQGKQHFEPVEFFGGEQNFKNTVKRDMLKKELSIEQKVKLIYVYYWENISPELIIAKINDAL
jgi:hypothetical protein